MGHDASFSDFMAARWSSLYRTAYLLTGSHHQAEDLLQDVLARTSVRWRSIRDKNLAEAYVRRGLVNQAARGWRRRGRESLVEELPDAGHGGGVDVHAEHLALWDEIRRLPPRMRATLVLRYLEDRPESEVAELLGVSVGSVKSQTHHALKRLRAAMTEMEPMP
ncbi:SigE family RNA polymerase sigma factor [Nocardioides currus]|uniref:SigE family RNA polymerase sigma factor n=1 Tax=Nocardioides currus TaxID=2133958 RepID=A0A2R7YRP4_9ACTN|nr:SigE family RNA polymerase sigma factor [Nocardioides currus]PUA79085.1 SigE family RNA polymerase sigma factor [Nocardioides currus]